MKAQSIPWSMNIARDHFGNQFLFKWQPQNNANKINSQSKSVKIRKLCQYRTMNCLHKFSITKNFLYRAHKTTICHFTHTTVWKGGIKEKGFSNPRSTKSKIDWIALLLSSLKAWLCSFQFCIQNFSQNSYLNSWRIRTRKTRWQLNYFKNSTAASLPLRQKFYW